MNDHKDSGVKIFDGVGTLTRGDTVLIVYQSPARLHRTQFIFDRLDEAYKANPDGIAVVMVVLPTADPPDKATRDENEARLKRLKVTRIVTVPTGGAFRISIVRTIMRAMFLLQGKSNQQTVCNTIDDGVNSILEKRSAKTPARAEIIGGLRTIYEGLGADWAADAPSSTIGLPPAL